MPPLLTALSGKQFYLFGIGVMIAELSADLFFAFAHREASLFRLDGSLRRRAGNADPSAPSDVVRGPDFGVPRALRRAPCS